MIVSKSQITLFLLQFLLLSSIIALSSPVLASEQGEPEFRPQVPQIVQDADETDERVEQTSETVSGLDGITRPISDIELSFVQPGELRKITVAVGDLVHVGDLLMQQADEIEQVQLKVLTARSRNLLPIHLAEVDLTQKRKDLQKVKGAYKKGAVNKWEVDQASLAVDTALLTLKLRKFEHDQDLLKLESINESIKKLTLNSPVEGIVEQINVEVGETVQALLPVIRIVKTQPLAIDLAVPLEEGKELSVGQECFVTFSDATQLTGQIVRVSSIADAAATTIEVTLELPNPEVRPAGERVLVSFAE